LNTLVCIESPNPGRGSHTALKLATNLTKTAKVFVLSAGGQIGNASLSLACQSSEINRVIHLDDPALDKADFMTLGMVLAEAARHLEASCIIVGESSDDEGQGMVPAAIAHHLHVPILSRVVSVRPSSTDQIEIISRSGGCLCTMATSLPIVLVTPPTPMSYKSYNPSKEGTFSAQIEKLTLAQLGIDGSRLVPRPELVGTMLRDTPPRILKLSCGEAARILLNTGRA
jgi:electron transfer flavoprotein alpha/beta subunit